MEKLVIKGGNQLNGRVRVSSAKNAVLPIIAATLLASTPSKLLEIPNLEDVGTISQVIESLGVKITRNEADDEIIFDASMLTATEAPYELVRKMRASFLVMGPLLARKGEAKISMPGGCAIGARPIDLHLKAFEALGAKIEITEDYVYAHAPEGLQGTQIYLDFPSVGATENVIMAASMAKGKTVIENAAEEPEIVDLATFLNAMGANIRGAGTNVIRIEGVESLHGAIHTVIPDRIEAGTYLIAAAMAGGDVFVENALPEHLKPVVAKLKEAGVTVEEDIDGIRVISTGKDLKAVDIKTLPYPGFPTDMQAQFMAFTTIAEGTSTVTETVFENRFMHVAELRKMGAHIDIDNRQAIVEGMPTLHGAVVNATDLRAGAALVCAGLAAEGTTEVGRLHHIDRGYDDLVGKLKRLGADIVRVTKKRSRRKQVPALRRSQENDTNTKKESVVERTSRAAMVKVTELRRKERRQKQTKPIAKTTPTMTLKRIVSPQNVGNTVSKFGRSLTFDLGIDLGTANVLIYVKGKGLVLDEPACVAKDTRTGDVLAVGESARRMIGRTPTGIEVIRPVQAGVIADYDMTEFMLKYFIRSVVPASRLMKTRIVVCVPSGITPVEKRAILEALLRTGAKKTVLIEEPLAAAMGTNLNEAEKVGAMVVDIGGGTTDIAVLCDTGVVVSESLRIGGDSFNEAIIQYVRRKKKLVIGPLTAEEIKISVGTVDRRSEEREIEIRGRDVITGLPKMVTLHSLEIQRALESQVMSILEAIKSILEKTPPELVAAIGDHGIILTGGGALISGLDRVISRSVGIAAYLVDLPRYAVIKGVAKTLDEMSSLRDTLEDLQ